MVFIDMLFPFTDLRITVSLSTFWSVKWGMFCWPLRTSMATVVPPKIGPSPLLRTSESNQKILASVIYWTMAREKIAMRRIESTSARQVTFSKRRRGLFKKANELSVLCDAEVAVIIFSSTGRLYEFCNTSMEDVMDKYERNFQGKEQRPQMKVYSRVVNTHIDLMQEQLNKLQHKQRQLLGEDLEGLSPKELQTLESRLQTTVKRVLSQKEQLLLENINQLQNKLREIQGMSINLNTKENEEIIPFKHGEYVQPSTQCISTIMDFTLNKQTISDQEDFDTTLHLGLTTTS